MDYSQYGLTATKASSSDHDKGIVQAPDGKFYQIDGFSHGQEKDLDADKGKVFGTSLQADAKAGGFDPSNFNTAGDVENALRSLGEEKEEFKSGFDEEYKPSDRVIAAKERVAAWEENDYDIYGSDREKELEAAGSGDNTSQGYLANYKMNLREKAAKGELGQTKALK